MNLLLQQACNYPESGYSKQRDSKPALLREKRKKEEYFEGLHSLPRSSAPVKVNQILSHDYSRLFPCMREMLWGQESTPKIMPTKPLYLRDY